MNQCQMSNADNDGSSSSDPHINDLALPYDTTVGRSSSASHTRPSAHHDVTPSASYLDIPCTSFRRSSCSSLDSTFTDLSELSFTSADLHSHRPLINSSERVPQHTLTLRSRFISKLRHFYHLNYGALLVLLAQFFGTLMNLSTRILEHPGPHGPGMHPFQILFARQSITSLTCTVWALSTGRIPDFPLGPADTKVRLLLVCRGVCGFLGVFGMYFSLLYLPLSEATVLTFLAPVLTCYLCSWVMPGESFSRQQQCAGLVSLAGVVFIARPTSFFTMASGDAGGAGGGQSAGNSTIPDTAPTERYSTPHPIPSQHLIAIAISLLGVVGATGAMTSIRAIGNRTHPFLSINYFSVFCTFMSLICLLVFKDVKFRLPGNWTEWALLGSLGACGFIMQWLLTRGLSYGSAGSSSSAANGGGKDLQAELSRKNTSAHSQEDIELGERRGSSGGPKKKDGENLRLKTKSYADGKEAPIKGSGNRATSMVYTQMLFALAADKLAFGVTPGTMSWIGSGLILAGAIWVASARDKNPQSAEPAVAVCPGRPERGRSDFGNGASGAFVAPSRSQARSERDRKAEAGMAVTTDEGVGLMSDLEDGSASEGAEIEERTRELR